MSARPAIARRSVRQARLAGNGPRYLVFVLIAILSLAGVKSILRGPTPLPPPPPAPVATQDLGAESFAQAFVHAYLSFDPAKIDSHNQQLQGYLAGSLGDAGQLITPSSGSGAQQVQWTVAVQDHPSGPNQRTIVVEAQTSREIEYVAVPVTRNRQGFLSVSNYPSLVGPPAADNHAQAPSEQEISDGDLLTVLKRALTNYVQGQGNDLRADLTADAVVSLPPTALQVRSIDSVTWAQPGQRAAIQLTALGADKTAYTLRYELGVTKRDRWYVTAVAVNPAQKEGN